MSPPSRRRPLILAVACLSLAHCSTPSARGERLAHAYCAACHAFPDPQLLDKETWRAGVLPQMAKRLGAGERSVFTASQNPDMVVLPTGVSAEDWGRIVAYYLERAPDTLPPQSLPAQPQLDPEFFRAGPFVPRLESSAIITLLRIDAAQARIFVGEAASDRLRIFDGNRHLVATLALGSPPTDVIAEQGHVLVLESGILAPNDQARGRLAQYDFAPDGSLRFTSTLIDSLFRPVFVRSFDLDGDGRNEFLICEFGDNRGRLALYRYDGSTYQREVLDATPGAIRFELHDLTGDGYPDIVALFAQGDERIVLFANDGKGHFPGRPRILARFPPVYGSMDFSMHDFNGDGRLDILYVNGDNFDFSRVLKPYHGIRILENDGRNNFTERYFFPMYGAAQAAVADFDKDGDLDILATSNFADAGRHAERGIMFFENTGRYAFRPFAFSVASHNQWNVMATGDLNRDGWPDVLVGAMHLENIARIQRRLPVPGLQTGIDPILVFENRMHP
jgi:VCBS repeat protein